MVFDIFGWTMLTAKFKVERTMAYYLRATHPHYSLYNSGFLSLKSTFSVSQLDSSYKLVTEEYFIPDLITFEVSSTI